MNPFLLSEKERLLSWRELRTYMTQLSDVGKYDEMIRWWSKAPICAYSIDARDCSLWPTPWELLNENMFCTSAVAYMMAQTLVLAGFDESRLVLYFVKGDDDERLVLVIDGQLVLNYSYGEAFSFADIKEEVQIYEQYVLVDGKARIR